jgi:hypothetical protein
MVKPSKLATKVLNEIKNENSTYDSLNCLLEILENKIDPDSKEIHIVATLYKIMENVKSLESYLKDYVKEETEFKNTLEELYEKDNRFGTCLITN